jgi:pimeloyl-ACP methyl ester carboxylesterase
MSFLPSRTETLDLRGTRYNVRHWEMQRGDAGAAPMLFMLHGRMDSSPTFQFVVDALRRSWHVVAPDWRGYGGSSWSSEPYWYYDYYADLDRLLAHYSPEQPARLVGHSMGANIASIYAAAKPERVSHLVMLDFLGLPTPSEGPTTVLRTWLDAAAGEPRLRPFPSTTAMAQQMLKANPRLTAPRADFLARATSRPHDDGSVERACDPWHNLPSPMVYRVDEVLETWRCVTAPVLLLVADDGYVQQRFGGDPAETGRRRACFADHELETISNCGHSMQHDQPEALAAAIEAFLDRRADLKARS